MDRRLEFALQESAKKNEEIQRQAALARKRALQERVNTSLAIARKAELAAKVDNLVPEL